MTLLISKALLTEDKKETLAKLCSTLITGSPACFRLLSRPRIFQSVVRREVWRGEHLKYNLDTQTAEWTGLGGEGWMSTDSEGAGDQSDDLRMKTFPHPAMCSCSLSASALHALTQAQSQTSPTAPAKTLLSQTSWEGFFRQLKCPGTPEPKIIGCALTKLQKPTFVLLFFFYFLRQEEYDFFSFFFLTAPQYQPCGPQEFL